MGGIRWGGPFLVLSWCRQELSVIRHEILVSNKVLLDQQVLFGILEEEVEVGGIIEPRKC